MQELAYTLADGMEYVRAAPRRGDSSVDAVRAAPVVLLRHRHELLHGGGQAPRGATFVGRAHGALFAQESKESGAAHALSDVRLVALTAQDVYCNVIRTGIEAMAATQGHTQSLHTNSLDEALALPTDFSARIARNTQLQLQLESGTCRPVDPWGGSYYIERLTHELAARARAHMAEVESLGGMVKAIEAGVPKLRIEEASARTQAPHRLWSAGDHRGESLSAAARGGGARPQGRQRRGAPDPDRAARPLRQERDGAACQRALDALTACAETRVGNLLELAVAAARARASVGEDLAGAGESVGASSGRDPGHLGSVCWRGG